MQGVGCFFRIGSLGHDISFCREAQGGPPAAWQGPVKKIPRTKNRQVQCSGNLQKGCCTNYRVYYAIEGKRVILLCDGGDKRSQSTDIARAIERWKEWQQRGKK